jgi:hypothetical protein
MKYYYFTYKDQNLVGSSVVWGNPDEFPLCQVLDMLEKRYRILLNWNEISEIQYYKFLEREKQNNA